MKLNGLVGNVKHIAHSLASIILMEYAAAAAAGGRAQLEIFEVFTDGGDENTNAILVSTACMRRSRLLIVVIYCVV